MAFIYVIENDINDKQYVGKTVFSIEKRWKEHLNDAFKRTVEHRPLYSAIRKYGPEHFSIRLLEQVPDELASERECYWISKLNTFNNGYNATMGGDGAMYIDHQKILDLFDKTNLSQNEIASKVGCSQDTVKKNVLANRDTPDWGARWQSRNRPNALGVSGKPVRCVETQQIFPSSTQAANWLIKEGKIKSQKYGRNKIPEVCRGQRKTVGSYHWEYVE